ncbi:MAG TPA: hypothetical protein PKB03_03570 [Baekduia sp.]|nr:hypothetical protein [Baekduia sp.]
MVRSGLSARAQRIIISVISLCLLVAGFFVHNKDETPKADAEVARLARSLPASMGSPPLGLWKAHSKTVSSHGFDDRQDNLNRRWLISRRCAGSCGLWIARETSLGTERARLTPREGRWFATFERRTDGCQTSQTGRARRSFAFSVSADQRHIQAVEINRALFPKCELARPYGPASAYSPRKDLNAVAQIQWEATLIGKDCDTGTCRVSIPDLGPRTADTPYQAQQRREGLAACRRSGHSAQQCLCTLRRVLSWTAPQVVGVMMAALDHSQKVDKLSAQQVRSDARACA